MPLRVLGTVALLVVIAIVIGALDHVAMAGSTIVALYAVASVLVIVAALQVRRDLKARASLAGAGAVLGPAAVSVADDGSLTVTVGSLRNGGVHRLAMRAVMLHDAERRRLALADPADRIIIPGDEVRDLALLADLDAPKGRYDLQEVRSGLSAKEALQESAFLSLVLQSAAAPGKDLRALLPRADLGEATGGAGTVAVARFQLSTEQD